MSGYLAVLRLSEDHPELLPKVSRLVRDGLGGRDGWSLEELLGLGLSREEVSLLERYGLLKAVRP
jgi:hypothetical protein